MKKHQDSAFRPRQDISSWRGWIHLEDMILSYRLMCYTKIFSPEKSRNTWKIRYFSRVFDIATISHLPTRQSPLVPLGQVDKWTAKPSPLLSEFPRITAAKTLKNHNHNDFLKLTFRALALRQTRGQRS